MSQNQTQKKQKKQGVDPNAQDANGHTALHIAALLNHGGLVPTLLHAGIDVACADNSGKTAAQLAHDKGSDEVLRQLDILKL